MSSQTVEHLRTEHETIGVVLTAFENYLDQSLVLASEDHHEMAALVDCVTESLFLLHEEKEETVLLPELSRRGLSWSDGTLAHVRQDHRHGRYLLRSLRHAAKEKRAWSSEQKRHVLSIGKEWVEFNRKHMALEEAQLFPFLDGSLQGEEDQKIVDQFRRIDAEFANMADAAELARVREEFVDKYKNL